MTQTPSSDSESPAPVLFLDKVLLQPRLGVLRGVEVFNLHVIEHCLDLHVPLVVAAQKTWHDTWPSGVEIMETTGDSGLWNGVKVVSRSLRRTFSVLLLANVGNSLIPAVALFRLFHRVARTVLIAHRNPSQRFLEILPRGNITVLAVNSIIAEHFRQAGFDRVDVHYGITQAEVFYPPVQREPQPPALNFCVLGYLDAPWKGAATAVNAFRKLPEPVRSRCRLHLVSYTHPPVFPDPKIRAYAWMAPAALPDLLRQMDVIIVPSWDEGVMRETFSQAMVQGMLTGLPVLANNLPVLVEKLDAGGGLVFHDEAELTRHMIALAQNSDLRRTLGAQARQTALARYVWNTQLFVERYLFPKE